MHFTLQRRGWEPSGQTTPNTRMHQRCKGGEGRGNHHFRVTTLFGGDRFCTPNYGVRLCISSATAATKKGFDRPTRTCTTWGAISPPIALITHIAPCPSIRPRSVGLLALSAGFRHTPTDRRFKWMTGGDKRAEQRRGGGLWAPKITRLRPVLQWARLAAAVAAGGVMV